MSEPVSSSSPTYGKPLVTPLNFKPKGISPSGLSLMEAVIPPAHTHRTLVLCFDGIGDQFNVDNSNITQFFSMLSKDNPASQVVYQVGMVGTTPLKAKLSKTIDMMVGNHLDANVMAGYEFLAQNYAAGDKICLFGFSGGAHAARALAGMVRKVGLLPRCNHQQVRSAFKMFSRDDEIGWRQSTTFSKVSSIDVDIEFVGVWDTVDSVGVIPRRLPKRNHKIRHFRHALSLDEHRVGFRPNFYHGFAGENFKYDVKRGEMPRSIKKVRVPAMSKDIKRLSNALHHHEPSLLELEQQYTDVAIQTSVEEVWFAGAHTDVGGGSVLKGTRNCLARIPLRWMIRQCFLANTGIMFRRSMFRQIGMDENTLFPYVLERPPTIYQTLPPRSSPRSPGSLKAYSAPQVVQNDSTIVAYRDDGSFVSEEHEDLADALCPVYDQLVLRPFWWILEVIPQILRYQRDEDARWNKEFVANTGRGRVIPMRKIKLHRSVRIRMEADGLNGGKYLPKAKLHVEPEWVS